MQEKLNVDEEYQKNLKFCSSFFTLLTKTDPATRDRIINSIKEELHYPGAYHSDIKADINKERILITWDWRKFDRASKGFYEFRPNQIIVDDIYRHDGKSIYDHTSANIQKSGVTLQKALSSYAILEDQAPTKGMSWLSDFLKYKDWVTQLHTLESTLAPILLSSPEEQANKPTVTDITKNIKTMVVSVSGPTTVKPSIPKEPSAYDWRFLGVQSKLLPSVVDYKTYNRWMITVLKYKGLSNLVYGFQYNSDATDRSRKAFEILSWMESNRDVVSTDNDLNVINNFMKSYCETNSATSTFSA